MEVARHIPDIQTPDIGVTDLVLNVEFTLRAVHTLDAERAISEFLDELDKQMIKYSATTAVATTAEIVRRRP
jgi:predicted nucleic acid-binding protein